jgi:lipoprotein Spr
MRVITIFFLSIVFMTSCKSLKKVTSRDVSVSKTTTRNRSSKNPTFIDGIEVTPGSTITSKHKTTATKQALYYETASSNSNIEKADWLQLKYSIIMDASVERLTNISLLKKIEEWWGTKYCMGGSTKNCIDCSAFTHLLMHDVYNIDLPRTAFEQYHACDKISADELREGDLVFFRTGGKTVSHVGVYITNNKFANASTSGGVLISDLNDPYWKSRYISAGRVLK